MGKHLDAELYREARKLNGSVNRIRELIASGADINRRHKHGHTPLLEAALRGRLDLAQVLLAAGADPNLCSNDGAGPLFWAVRCADLELVELLLLHHADPNVCRDGAASPLLGAIDTRNVNIVLRLVEAGAAVDHKYLGKTMLEWAASQPEIAAVLRCARRTSYTSKSVSGSGSVETDATERRI